MNVGVMFHERRRDTWSAPVTKTTRTVVGFGLCTGVASPSNGSNTPAHFIGLKTGTSWAKSSDGNWWTTGHSITRGTSGGHATLGSPGSDMALRVSLDEETIETAVYLRFTKLTATSLRIEAFVPEGGDKPTVEDFRNQMRRAVFSASVGNHSGYTLYSVDVTTNEAGLGYFNAVNIFSALLDSETQVLGGIVWSETEAVMLS